MRRPGKTKAQKQHEREQRALLRLRKAAVRWSMLSESEFDAAKAELPLAFAELGAACDAYSNALTARDQRKLGVRFSTPKSVADDARAARAIGDMLAEAMYGEPKS